MKNQVAVIGGGFSGLVNAFLIGETDLFEEHISVGYPSHCTGLVSLRFVKLLGSIAEENILNEYRSIIVKDLSNRDLFILKVGKIYRLDREKLEKDLLKEAIDKGSRTYLHRKIIDLEYNGGRVCLKIRGKNIFEIKCYDENTPLILADGALGELSRKFIKRDRKDLIVGSQVIAHIDPGQIDLENILVFVNNDLFPNFFGWFVPLSPREAIIGGGFTLNTRTSVYLKYFLHRLRKIGLLKDLEIKRIYGGLITRSLSIHHVFRNIIITGDAAGLTKAFSGGGLFPSLYQAIAIKESFKKYSDIIQFKSRYMRYMKKLLKELSTQKFLTDKIINLGIENFAKIISHITDSIYIDYDYHANIFKSKIEISKIFSKQ
jgi:flavin-dependent dehydrogenase